VQLAEAKLLPLGIRQQPWKRTQFNLRYRPPDSARKVEGTPKRRDRLRKGQKPWQPNYRATREAALFPIAQDFIRTHILIIIDVMSPEQHRTFDYDIYIGHFMGDQKAADYIAEILINHRLRVCRSSRAWSVRDGHKLALYRSRWYLLLASPNAAKSVTIDDELRFWIELNGFNDIVIGLIEGEFQKDVVPADHVHSLAKVAWLDLRNFSQSDTRTVGLVLDAFHGRLKPLDVFTQFFGDRPAQEPVADGRPRPQQPEEITILFQRSPQKEPPPRPQDLVAGDSTGEPGGYYEASGPEQAVTGQERAAASAAASPPAPGGSGAEEGFDAPDVGDEFPNQATVDQLQFSVTAPRPLWPGESHEIFFWAHLESQLSAILRRLKEQLGRTQYERLATISQGPYRVKRGTVLSVALSVQDLIVHHSTKTVLWNGKSGNAVFVVYVPTEIPLGNRVGTFSILVEGLELATVDFTIQIGTRKQKLCRVPAKSRRHKQAFASFASEDRAADFARVQGMAKVAPDMNVFLDVLNLRSGQNWEREITRAIAKSNVFYLFWSEHASRSQWVDKEWRFAYATKGFGFIDPVPLQSPRVAPPPKELSAKHFNDIWIHYIDGTWPTGLAASNAAGASGIGDTPGPG
jgi:hypothetical protein